MDNIDKMITIIDYGLGNLRSVQKAFERLNVKAIISNDEKEIADAEKLVLPGVGHFAMGMHHLKEFKLIDVLNTKVLLDKTPILGICLGMQLMTEFSEEGNCAGLGWIEAKTTRFIFNGNGTGRDLKIPHMGWNDIRFVKNTPLQNEFETISSFYFVHSYYVNCKDENDRLTRTEYGIEFDSGFQRENITGVQFHPEKSHAAGLKLLKNFIHSEVPCTDLV